MFRLELLKIFSSYYKTVNPIIEKWMFAGVRTTYMNIYNFSDVDISILKINQEGDSGNAYISLETRLKSFLEGIMKECEYEKMETNMLKFLSIITTNGSYVPLKFFFNFEISRILTTNNELK